MNRERDYWWLPLTGALFVLLVIVGGIIGGEPPSADDPTAEIVEHYLDNKDAILIGSLVSAIGTFLFLIFASYLRNLLRAASGERGVLANTAFAGAIILAVAGAIDSMILVALAESADDLEPSSVEALQGLWDNDWIPFVLGAGSFLLAAGLSTLSHGALPKWLGWIAVLLGVVTFTPIGFVGFLGGALWILVASIVLTLRARSAGAGPGDPSVPSAAGAPGPNP
jgi:hypothetical protein